MSHVLERKIADLILLIPSDQQHFARKRIDNIIRVVSDSQIEELNWKSINGEVESLNERITNNMMKVICTLTLVDRDQLKSKCRKRELNDVRQIAMWIIRKGTSMSFYDVGKVFNRHHATVLHAVKNVEGLIQTDNKYRADVEQILNHLDYENLNREFQRLNK
jgi:chromosomal replication initiation ATPase DnaA